MFRKVVKSVGILLVALVLVVAVLVARAKWVLERSYAEVPLPPIAADTSPEGVARGELLFQSICLECHGGADGRATGKRLDEVPAFLGEFRSANLAHPERGVRKTSDGKIARTIRYGVLPNGSFSPLMSSFSKVGDRDVAALLGYMRSNTPIFDPAGEAQPRSRLTLAGTAILVYVGGVQLDGPASGVAVPTKAATAEYGRYMVQVLDCAGCHTDGFGSDKMASADAFAGGFELTGPTGEKIFTRNITPDDETGIGRWSVDDFERAVTRGTTPDGHLVRKPMPLFSRLDRTDVEAVYAYLRTVPKVHRPNNPGGAPRVKADPNERPEALFTKLGCVGCHGDNAVHRDKLAGALGKPDDEVAEWILDAQARKPGVAMPTFKTVLDREQALALARYAKGLASGRSTTAVR